MVTLQMGELCAVTEGGNLLEILRRERAFSGRLGQIASPCGGHGTCGKCRIGVSAAEGTVSAPSAEETALLARVTDPLPEGYVWRLACRCTVQDGSVLLWLPETEHALSGAQAEGTAAEATAPWVRWQETALVRPTLEDPVSVDENLRRSRIDTPVTASASNRITALLTAAIDRAPKEADPVPLWIAGHDSRILDAGEVPHPLYGAAIDLGTTTIALSLWRDDGVRMAGTVFANPTRPYGADVISRISYAMENENGTEILCEKMRAGIEEGLETLAAEAGIDKKQITCRILAGNSVMEHLYAGLNPSPIGKVPFYPQSRFGAVMDTDPATYLAPAAASYVGGDVLMGAAWLLWDKPERKDRTILFLDLGTNGELGIYKEGKWIFAAAAAGPAFEGAHIALGMPATAGAVTRIRWDYDRFTLSAVGDKPPVGLCGSGILDGMRQMLTLGLADEYGSLIEDPEEWKAQLPEGLGVDEDGEMCVFAPGIYLTQGDIRQIQMARGAIAAGVEVLCQAAGVEADGIDEVCLAGSFGHALDVTSAAVVGLFPKVLADRVTGVGNSSEAGCASFWLHGSFRETLETVRQNAAYIELSAQSGFSDLYMEKMCFELD